MALVVIASAKGAPGATTLTVALAALTPGAIAADLDPDGGDLALRYRREDGAPLDPQLGLLSLAASLRRDHTGPTGQAAPLTEHLQVSSGGLEVLLGVTGPDQAVGLGPLWSPLGRALADTDRAVFADCGRIGPASPAMPVLMQADAVILVARAELEELSHLRERLRFLIATLPGRYSGPARVGVILVARERDRAAGPRTEQLLRSSGLAVPVLGTMADDPRGAARVRGLHGGRAGRTTLVRSVRTLLPDVIKLIGYVPAEAYSVEPDPAEAYSIEPDPVDPIDVDPVDVNPVARPVDPRLRPGGPSRPIDPSLRGVELPPRSVELPVGPPRLRPPRPELLPLAPAPPPPVPLPPAPPAAGLISPYQAPPEAVAEPVDDVFAEPDDWNERLWAADPAVLFPDHQSEADRPTGEIPVVREPEQTYGDPAYTEPADSGATHPEVADPEMTYPEMAYPEATHTDPVHAEQVHPEQAHAEQAHAEPAHTEVPGSEPGGEPSPPAAETGWPGPDTGPLNTVTPLQNWGH